MTFFLENILFPCLAFVVLSVWVLRRRPRAAPPRRGRFTALMAAGFVGLSAATWGLVSGLRPGDGWGGMPALLLALGTGAGALHCLAGLVFGLLSGGCPLGRQTRTGHTPRPPGLGPRPGRRSAAPRRRHGRHSRHSRHSPERRRHAAA